MSEVSLLEELDNNRELSHDLNFSKELVAQLHTFYVPEEVSIPENEIVKIIGKSMLIPDRILMPKQIQLLNFLKHSQKAAVSAPTSFGKTFTVMEHIAQSEYMSIVYIVHTKSLRDEVYLNLIRFFKDRYHIMISIDEEIPTSPFIYILVSDGQNIPSDMFSSIDLLVIDEAYNLILIPESERSFAINSTCQKLIKNSSRVFLLGPYISGLKGSLSEQFVFYSTKYSPVKTKIIEGRELLNFFPNPESAFIHLVNNKERTLGYFPSKIKMYDYMSYILTRSGMPDIVESDFINYLEEIYPDFWFLPKIMKKGVGIFHSAFAKYITLYSLKMFNNGDFNGILHTSSILEGVNTPAKNIVIFETKDGGNDLTPFKFFNLCGRAGRVGTEIIGKVFNFGDEYNNRYEESAQSLYIWNEDNPSEYEIFDKSTLLDDERHNEQLKQDLLVLLGKCNANWEWYKEFSFYLGGYLKTVSLLTRFLSYRRILLRDITSGELLTTQGHINKNKIINHIYNYFMQNNKFHPGGDFGFYTSTVMAELLRSAHHGIDESIRNYVSILNQYIFELDDIDKNRYVVALMKLVYSYIPHNFYQSAIILCELLSRDQEIPQIYIEEISGDRFLSRIKHFVAGDRNYPKIKTQLREMGFIPSLSNKIMNYLRKDTGISDDISKRDLMKKIKSYEVDSSTKISSYERTNLSFVIR